MTEGKNPCPPKILSSCRPKECGVEFCAFREVLGIWGRGVDRNTQNVIIPIQVKVDSY